MSTVTYKVICISLYKADIRELDAKVERLKVLGFSRANRSMLIRYALSKVAMDEVDEDELYKVRGR